MRLMHSHHHYHRRAHVAHFAPPSATGMWACSRAVPMEEGEEKKRQGPPDGGSKSTDLLYRHVLTGTSPSLSPHPALLLTKSNLRQETDGEFLSADTHPSGPCQQLKEQAHGSEPFIHRVPPEIVTDIFMLFISESVAASGFHIDGRRSQSKWQSLAEVLATVCVRWRSIAHSTPQLWTNLNLKFNIWYSKWLSFPPLDLIEQWIDRSGELPLSINFCALSFKYTHLFHYTLDGTTIWDHIAQIIGMLKKCSKRWESLIYTGHERLLHEFSIDDDLPQLRTLSMRLVGERLSEPVFRLRPQRLTTLSISRIRLVEILKFNWDHITQLTLEYIIRSECFEAICKAPRLVRCTFRRPRTVSSDDIRLPCPKAPITHPTIQHIEFREDHVLYSVLQHLSCPSLKTLVLEGTSDSTFELPIILQFLMRSECSLEQLSLLNLDGQRMFSLPTAVIRFYKAIPTVQHLRLSCRSWMLGPFLEPLTEFSPVLGREQPRYLPSLRSLVLVGYAFQDWQLLPAIFGTQRTALPAMECHRRLLQSVAIIATSKEISDEVSFCDVGEETLKRMLWLKESVGVEWDIRIKRKRR